MLFHSHLASFRPSPDSGFTHASNPRRFAYCCQIRIDYHYRSINLSMGYPAPVGAEAGEVPALRKFSPTSGAISFRVAHVFLSLAQQHVRLLKGKKNAKLRFSYDSLGCRFALLIQSSAFIRSVEVSPASCAPRSARLLTICGRSMFVRRVSAAAPKAMHRASIQNKRFMACSIASGSRITFMLLDLFFGGMVRPPVRNSGHKLREVCRPIAHVRQVLLQAVPVIGRVGIGKVNDERSDNALIVIVGKINETYDGDESLSLIIVIKSQVTDEAQERAFKSMAVKGCAIACGLLACRPHARAFNMGLLWLAHAKKFRKPVIDSARGERVNSISQVSDAIKRPAEFEPFGFRHFFIVQDSVKSVSESGYVGSREGVLRVVIVWYINHVIPFLSREGEKAAGRSFCQD
jgi:hypothetical protein